MVPIRRRKSVLYPPNPSEIPGQGVCDLSIGGSLHGEGMERAEIRPENLPLSWGDQSSSASSTSRISRSSSTTLSSASGGSTATGSTGRPRRARRRISQTTTDTLPERAAASRRGLQWGSCCSGWYAWIRAYRRPSRARRRRSSGWAGMAPISDPPTHCPKVGGSGAKVSEHGLQTVDDRPHTL